MKRVAFLLSGLDSGGLENYLLRFLTSKSSNFDHVYVYCKNDAGGQLETQYTALPNVEVIYFKLGYWDNAAYQKLGEDFHHKKIDIVCDFTGNFAGKVLQVAAKVGIKKRVVFYRSSSNRFKSTWVKNVYNTYVHRLTNKYATDILANSQFGLDFFFPKNAQDKRAKVIYNGLPISDFEIEHQNLRTTLEIPSNAFVIGHTGRFNEAKNHALILEVANDLTQQYEDIYFLLCGNGVRKNLKDAIENWKGKNQVRLFDNRTDIPVFLNTLDLFFFPSITEGQPNSLIEAMAIGLPIIASNIPPVKETFLDHSCLFSPFDVEGFKSAIIDAYKERRGKSASLIQDTKERFNSQHRFEEFYKILNDGANR